MYGSRVIRASGCQRSVATVLGSISAQWNLRGGRWISVESRTLKNQSNIIPQGSEIGSDEELRLTSTEEEESESEEEEDKKARKKKKKEKKEKKEKKDKKKKKEKEREKEKDDRCGKSFFSYDFNVPVLDLLIDYKLTVSFGKMTFSWSGF